jgi:hypothetical protein
MVRRLKMTNTRNIRKTTLRVLTGLVLAFWGAVFIGCENCDDCRVVVVDDTPPDAPQGVYSITGDEAVYIYWYESPEPDISHYWVWRSEEALEGPYERKWKTYDNYYVDREVENGSTYYYAVTAIDFDGNESEELSWDDVQDTPRPEGSGVVLWDVREEPHVSAFGFKKAQVVDWEASSADIFFEYDTELGAFFVWVANYDTYIQDFGYTGSLDELDWAPEVGWSEVGWLEAVLGHSYYVYTVDRHYAKFRVDYLDYRDGSVEISWAYQTVQDWPELVPNLPERLAGYASSKEIIDSGNLR